MRKLSECAIPNKYSLCPVCLEIFINDLGFLTDANCPNDGTEMKNGTLEELLKEKESCQKKS